MEFGIRCLEFGFNLTSHTWWDRIAIAALEQNFRVLLTSRLHFGGKFCDDATQRPSICFEVVVRTHDDLWWSVPPSDCHRRDGTLFFLGLVQGSCQAKVANSDGAVWGHHNVWRLNVSVDDICTVQIINRTQQIVDHYNEVLLGEVANIGLNHLSEAVLPEVHHQEHRAQLFRFHLVFRYYDIKEAYRKMVRWMFG